MKTITKEYTVYPVTELSANALKNAHNTYVQTIDYDWWELIFCDIKTIGKILGLDITEIFFSGFSQQGSGACFEGTFTPKKYIIRDINSIFNDEELRDIATKFAQLTYAVSVKHVGNYYHEFCTQFDFNNMEENNVLSKTQEEEFIKKAKNAFYSYMRYIYMNLEIFWNDLTSLDEFLEICEYNEYQFLENGTLFAE